MALLFNLGLLVGLKCLVENSLQVPNVFAVNLFKNDVSPTTWIFPLGISYMVFQTIAYFLDINNEITRAEKNLLKFAALLLFFPKMIVGPIQRYRDSTAELDFNSATPERTSEGIRRFIIGLAKKVLIADVIAKFINPVFTHTDPSITTPQAWLVLVGYAIQLYYDFSGYTDMAIGIGEIFGFKLVENFNWPYVSKSVTEFWRRWHISLSGWFRDYIFTPLQFRFRKQKSYPIQVSILLIFLLTGIWHGLGWHYIAWGLMLGIIIGFEATKLGRKLQKAWKPLQHLWTIFWILLSWVLFRAPDMTFASNFYKALFGLQGTVSPLPFSQTVPFPVVENSVKIAYVVGIFFAIPFISWLQFRFQSGKVLPLGVRILFDIGLALILIYCLGLIAASGPMPGIYGQF
ncbi:MAG TPA: MBOAT family O-acyltransferase [Anaerolineaceae bacterium]|nr:MBOAT family O-acyltransferase [Anaerolineaceae bacterium]